MRSTRVPPPARMFQKTIRTCGLPSTPRACPATPPGGPAPPLRTPHVRLTIAASGLQRDGTLDRPRHRDARVTRRVAVAVARRPGGARLGQSPRRVQELADRPGLQERVRLGARPDPLDRLVRHP